MSASEWKGIWSNCKERDGDQCYNAATNTTPGVAQFHMGACSDGSDVYDPVRNTGGAKCGFGTKLASVISKAPSNKPSIPN